MEYPLFIRPYLEPDYTLILKIYSQSKLDELRYEKQAFQLLPLEQDRKRLRSIFEGDIIVYANPGVYGFAALCQNEIRALFVAPKSRGQGIGAKLLTHLLAQSDSPLSLYVAKSNLPAKLLYEKFGFKIVDEFQTEYNGIDVVANKMIGPSPHASKLGIHG